MNHNALVTELLSQLETMLELPKDTALVTPHTDALAKVFAELTGISTEDDMNQSEHSYTDKGVAICPVQAAKCLKEPLRSQVFIQGVQEAIDDALERAAGQPIRVLYAGTGPYGLLLLPLLALKYRDAPIKASLVDIHPENMASIRGLIKAFGIEQVVVSTDVSDACQWQPAHDEGFDIIISETMTHLLRREPQVFIFAHLEQFLKPEGTLIPEQIPLSASLVDSTRRVELGCFYSLNRDTARQLRQGQRDAYQGTITVPEDKDLPTTLQLDTDLVVYKKHTLTLNETSLAIPVTIDQLYFGERRTIPFHYDFSNEPDFVFDTPHYTPDPELTASDVSSESGLLHLKRFWHKIQQDKARMMDDTLRQQEFSLDMALVDACGGNFQKWLEYAYQQHPPCFEGFESWVVDKHSLNSDSIARINSELTQQGLTNR